MRRQGRRARLLPGRQARLSRSGAHRCRLRGLLLRRRHRGRPRRGRADQRPDGISLRRTRQVRAGRSARAGQGRLRQPPRRRTVFVSRLRPCLRGARAHQFQQARDPDRAFALDRAVPKSSGSALRSFRAVGPSYRTGIRRALGRSDHGDDGGGALRQSHSDHDRRRRLSRPAALLCQPLHSEDAAGHQADPDLAHHRRASRGRRDAVLLHPRYRDRLDAARRGADRQICGNSAGRDRPLPRRQALQRTYLLGSGFGAGADRAARSGVASRRRRGDGEESRRRDTAVEHADGALGRERATGCRIIAICQRRPLPGAVLAYGVMVMSSALSRRTVLQLAGAAALPLSSGLFDAAQAAPSGTLTIAYNVNLPSFDPTVGLSAVNPTIQSIYQSIFDTYVGQAPDLSFKPGLLTKWGWNADRTKITLELRKGATWHDGSPVTPEDVVWSLRRAADTKSGNPIQFVWSKVGNFKIDGNTITGDVLEFEPTIFKWMAFLTGFVLPKAYYEKVGAEGFEKKPVGTGPYMVDAYEGNAFLRLKSNPNYWGGKPAFDTVIFKFVPDATSRVAEIESGSSDVTLEVPYEEFDRLKKKPGLAGVATPISDIGMIFISNVEPMLDKNVRLAAHHAIDKKAIVDRLLHGYGVPIATLEAPGYAAFDPTIKVTYDPDLAKSLLAKSGFSPEKPVKFTIQTTRGFKPKDYEMIQAIVGMWRKVGIEATIEVYEIAQHFELRARHALAP